MTCHAIIEIGSPLWWKMLLATIAIGSTFIFCATRVRAARKIITTIFGIILIADAVLIYPYMIYLGQWNLQSSLPLNLCSISGILSGIVLLKRNQLAYEFLLFWGLPAAFHALLTPEMTLGSNELIIYDYYICHGGILFSALYLSIVFKMQPRRNSWIKIFLYNQLLIIIVGTIDWMIDANYMYLIKKPIAQNPFVIGEWPWYILGLELAGLLHFYLVYISFYFVRKKEPMDSPAYS